MYFSIKRAMKIAGKKYLPCVCYPLTKKLFSTIDKLEKEGSASIHKEKVCFQSGKIIKKSVVTTVNQAIGVSAENDKTTEKDTFKADASVKQSVKRSKKSDKVSTSKAEKANEKIDETKKEVGEDF